MRRGTTSPPWCPSPSHRPGGALPPRPRLPVSKALCGCDALERGGRIYPRRIPPPVRAGDACGLGQSKASGSRPGGPFSPHARPKANALGLKPSPMAAVPRRTKGRERRPDHAGDRHEVAGGGRRPRSSSGNPLGIGVPRRGDLAGPHLGHHGRAPPWPRAAAPEPGARDR